MNKPYILLPIFLILTAFGCETKVVQPDQGAANAERNIIGSNNSEENLCDFSEYEPVRVSHFVSSSLLEKSEPQYPDEAKTKGISGVVSVKILVDGDGNVFKACALDGPEELRAVSEEAALKWRFRRNRAKDSKVSYVVDGITFRFILDGEESTVQTADASTGSSNK